MVNKKEDIFPKTMETKSEKPKYSIWNKTMKILNRDSDFTFRTLCLLIGIFLCSYGLGAIAMFL